MNQLHKSTDGFVQIQNVTCLMQVSLIKKPFAVIIVTQFYRLTSMPLYQESMIGTATLIAVDLQVSSLQGEQIVGIAIK